MPTSSSTSSSSSPFIVEVQGSVSQRLYRYDTSAAAESTHQSRSDYIRRKQAVLQPPSWTQHAASEVPDLHHEPKDGNNNNKDKKKREIRTRGAGGMTSTLSLTPLSTEAEKEAHAAAIKMLQQRDHPARGNCILPRKNNIISTITSSDPSKVNSRKNSPPLSPHTTNDNTTKKAEAAASIVSEAFGKNEAGVVKMFSHQGVEKVAEKDVAWRERMHERKNEIGKSSTVVSSSTTKTNHTIASNNNNESLTRAPRKREAPPSQPMAIGDILGKSKNITHSMISQRDRYDKLEEERLKKMKSELEKNGWEQSVSPGGPSKRIGDRIYAGLPKNLNESEQRVYEELKKRQQQGYY